MDNTDQRTCTNLRLISTVKVNQRLRINFGYNVVDVVDNTTYNAFTAFLVCDTWNYTKHSLKKIFTEDTSALCAKLIKNNCIQELTNIRGLLSKSSIGLNNLKTAYKNDGVAIVHIDSIMEDYITMQINNINEYLQTHNKIS